MLENRQIHTTNDTQGHTIHLLTYQWFAQGKGKWEIWLYKAYASSDFDIYNSPPGCKSCLSRHLREGRGPDNERWGGLASWTIPSNHLYKLLAPCKGSQNSLGFWIPCCEFQIPGTRFQIAYQWNLDSRLQALEGFQITWAVFRISKSKIWIPQVKKSRILESKTKIFPGFRIP